jgi:RNA polymerase sigma-70 factor (ECF subfamily)
LDKEAFTKIYAARFRYVWNVCLTLLRNPEDTDDAVQETFLRLLQQEDPPETAEHLRAWLTVTARNVCRDELRRFRRKELSLDAAEGTAVLPPEIDETLAAVRSLPEKYRLPIYLFYYEELTTAQIAATLNRRESTVRSDLRRGREKLKQMLGGIENER